MAHGGCDPVQAAVAAAMAAQGRIDVLINNAGRGQQLPFLRQSLAQARSEMETNYLGVLNVLHAVLSHMVAADRRGAQRRLDLRHGGHAEHGQLQRQQGGAQSSDPVTAP